MKLTCTTEEESFNLRSCLTTTNSEVVSNCRIKFFRIENSLHITFGKVNNYSTIELRHCAGMTRIPPRWRPIRRHWSRVKYDLLNFGINRNTLCHPECRLPSYGKTTSLAVSPSNLSRNIVNNTYVSTAGNECCSWSKYCPRFSAIP